MEQFELIENYLSNEMTPEAKAAFEASLLTDAALAENFALYKAINNEMASTVENKEVEFRSNLKPLQNKFFSKTNKIAENKGGKVRKMIFTALSAAAILVLVFVLVKPGGKTYTTDELYAMYNKHDAVENTVRGGGNVSTEAATKLFNDKKYAEAIPLFEDPKVTTAEAKFLLGVCYLETNAIDKALASFKGVYESKSVFAEKSVWYIALTHLKNKDKENCKAQLKAIAASSSYYAKAQELLKKL